MKNHFLTYFTTTAFLVSCSPVGPDYQGPPETGHAQTFLGGNQRPAKIDQWWRKLGSSELNRLVSRALKNNHDIAIAGQRLRESRALRKQAASTILPHANANLGYTQTSVSSFTGGSSFDGLGGAGFLDDPLKYWNTGVDVSWEIDVFGGGRRRIRGAHARQQAAHEALHAARLAIAAEVTETYFTIASLREQLAKLNQQTSLLQQQVNNTRQRTKAGAGSRTQLDRDISRLELTRAQTPTLKAGIITQTRRLALLLGSPPGALDGQRLAAKKLPSSLPLTRTGIPAQLTLRRPDLRMTERNLAATTEDIGVAVSNFYPKFTIGGGPANITRSSGDLFKASNFFWQFTPTARWSIFSSGANRAALEAASARQKATMLSYQKSVLAAVGEVESELANLRAETRRLAIVQRARTAAASAARRVRTSHKAGATDYVNVLVEEANLRQIEITEIRVKSQMLQVWIRLHKALGGGWR